MTPFKTATFSALITCSLGLAVPGFAQTTSVQMAPPATMPGSMTAKLSAANEVPPNNSVASGTVETKLNKDTGELSWTITYSGLSGPATAAHFHGPALAGQNAGVALPISGALTSPIKGSAKLTPAQVADVMAGKWYANVHTAANPGGEIRGQVSAQP